ncbi:hypothetical protein B0H63DRAFT_190579 [Podospora didyma]|uniref:Uncharacterized protein n=1 Tax=Podospora didyma TaxID=330526 RepID=A0AAE0NR64_9PEZI|nr:hypothetical protein B0H63DRAFT_190579 [Podospora didyma]
MDSAACDVEGIADLYGLGIRLGFYFQWISSLLVTLFCQEDEPLYRAVNLLLQLAVFVCLVFLSATGAIHAPEVLVAFWMLIGALSSLTGDVISPFGTASGAARLLMYAALSVYGCWFWFGGLETLPGFLCGGTPLFFGGDIANGPLRTLGKVVSVLGLLACTSLLVYSAFLAWKRMQDNGSGDMKTTTSRARPQTEIPLLAISVAVIALSIASMERLVRENQLVGVDDLFAAGQIIPFIVGLAGLVNTVVPVVLFGKFLKPRCWLVFRHHLT